MSDKQKILIADDSELNRALLAEILGGEYDYLYAENGVEALACLEHRADVALVLLDVHMPEMDGFEVLEVMNRLRLIEDVPVIMISAEDDISAIERAYDLGVTDYIRRPFESLVIRRRVSNTLMQYAKQARLTSLVDHEVREMEKTSNLLVNIFSHVVGYRNRESGPHVLHIRTIAELLLHQLVKKTDRYRLTEQDISLICTASALHDIGKISIPEEVLNKPGRLTDEEFERVKTHTVIGAKILRELPLYQDEPLVKYAYEICRWHHERWDGGGYPDGLRGDAIPISAQVVALADVYDALTSERCYKQAYAHETAISMIVGGECGAFSPLLLACLNEIASALPTALRAAADTTIRGDTDRRELRLRTEELLNSAELPQSSRAQRRIELARARADFYAEQCGGLQFDYYSATDRFSVIDWSEPDARQAARSLQEPGHARLLSRKDQSRLRAGFDQATPEQPDFEMNVLIPVRQDFRWHRLCVRTFWQTVPRAQLVGATGRFIDVHEQLIRSGDGAMKLRQQSADASVAIRTLQEVFDTVRLVDPRMSRVMRLDDNGCLTQTDTPCHAVWDRSARCENCISMQTMLHKDRRSKLEFADDDVYFVIAQYVEIEGRPCVLELVSRIADGRWIDVDGARLLLDRPQASDDAASFDALTGARSRYYYEESLAEMDHLDGMVVIDADNFKAINDNYGHIVGDMALRTIAKTISSCVRSTDILVRYGGDEFLLLFPQIPEQTLYDRIEQIRAAVRAAKIEGYPDIQLSVSLGGVYRAGPPAMALHEADRKMYRDKASKPRMERKSQT